MNVIDVKFRGKRVDNGDWVYGSLDNTDDREWYIIYRDDSYAPYSIRVIPETVGQWSTLTDLDEVEIYKGDILLFKDGKYKEVDFMRGCFGVIQIHENGKSFGSYMIDISYVEGNIFENPELLNN